MLATVLSARNTKVSKNTRTLLSSKKHINIHVIITVSVMKAKSVFWEYIAKGYLPSLMKAFLRR